MQTITYTHEGKTRTGHYSLREDIAACEGGYDQNICMPHEDHGAREYGYSHGGAEYRALMDAIYEHEGEDAIRAGRLARYGAL